MRVQNIAKGQSVSEANYDNLTVENFSERFGIRFRVNKEQKARGISRELALAEWVAAQKSATVQQKMQVKLADKATPVVVAKPQEPDEATGLLPGDRFRIVGEVAEFLFAYRHVSGIIRATETVKNSQGFYDDIWIINRKAKLEKVKNVAS